MRTRERIQIGLGILGSVVLLGILGLRLMRDAREDAASTPPPAPTVPAASSRSASPSPAARQVRLANRTITLEPGRRKFPKAFAELQTPSARKTVSYIVVSEPPVSKFVRERAAACGARVLGFMPVNSLVVEAGERALRKLEADAFFAAAYELDPKDKIQEHVRERIAAQPTTVDVTVVPLMATDVEPLEAFVREKGGAIIPESDKRPVLRARIPAAVVDELSKRGEVRWIETYSPAKLLNNVAVNPGLMNVRPVWNLHGLTGRGQNITTADSGLDTGNVDTLMADFTGRVYKIGTVSGCYKYDRHGHGTHTAGSIVGNGTLSNGEITGTAPRARLYVWQGLKSDGYLYAPSNDELFQPEPEDFPAYICSCSWGYSDTASYTYNCVSADEYVWEHPENLGVFAAGNLGHLEQGTIADPAGAKNVLAVGATETRRSGFSAPYSSYTDNPSGLAVFSARGPMRDGRVKPDICAPGAMILSTRTTKVAQETTVGWLAYADNLNYTYDSGTSMATPLVAGAAALVREWLVDRRGFAHPTAALVKAILMGGAYDMSVDAGADCGGAAPNNRQGWGRVDLEETLFPSNRMVMCVDRIPFAEGNDYVLTVTATNAAPLDVQLVWIDYPAESYAASALVNDLDLVISNKTTGAVWFGNDVEGGDHVNNVEGVRVKLAVPGKYAIHVKGVKVPHGSTEGGAAALYARGAFMEPNGTIIRVR